MSTGRIRSSAAYGLINRHLPTLQRTGNALSGDRVNLPATKLVTRKFSLLISATENPLLHAVTVTAANDDQRNIGVFADSS